MKKEKTIISYAVWINMIHLILCFGCYFLKKFALFDASGVHVSVFAAELIIWFLGGMIYTLDAGKNDSKGGIKFALLSVLPILFVTLLGAVIAYSGQEAPADWFGFFFVGSAINFWHTPAVLLSKFITENGYLLYAVNIIILSAVSMLGHFYGASLNKAASRRTRNKKTATNKTSA